MTSDERDKIASLIQAHQHEAAASMLLRVCPEVDPVVAMHILANIHLTSTIIELAHELRQATLCVKQYMSDTDDKRIM